MNFLPVFVTGFALLLAQLTVAHAAVPPIPITLSQQGKATLPIVISASASAETKASAAQLAEGLQKITGGAFEVLTSNEPAGIVVGTAAEWPGIVPPAPAGEPENLGRDDYVIRSAPGTLYLVGRSATGERNAIWDLFHRLGFRQFFPGPHWEIWPSTPTLQVGIDTYQTPDFKTRRLALGGGRNGLATEARFAQWLERNRMVSGFVVPRGHAWQGIPRAKKAFIAEHPEVLVPRADGTPGSKLDPAQPATLQIAAEYFTEMMEKEFQKNPAADGISVEPTDGGGWREDSPLGSPSNQAVTVANHVARIFQQKFPGKKVGLLAYSYHSAPPTIDVEPNVSVAVSLYAIRGGYTPEQLLAGWKARGADVGIAHPTFNIWTYYRDKPGAGNAADLQALARDLPHYHQLGARIWSASTTPAWAPYGLGHYLISRLLWDTTEARRAGEIVSDFYTRAFGAAAPEMRAYHEKFLLALARPLLSEDLLGRMFRQLDAALQKAESPAMQARILDYVVHARGMELYLAYQNSEPASRQQAYENLAQFAWRAADCDMLSSYAIIHRSPTWDKALTKWTPPAGEAPTLSEAEVRALLTKGIAANKLIDFEAVAYSSNLVPLPSAASLPVATRELTITGPNVLHAYAEQRGSGFDFTITGAVLWPNRGPVRLRLFAADNPEDVPVATHEIPADKEPHAVHLDSPFVGAHRLEILDSAGGTTVAWPEGQRVAYPASPERSLRMKSSQLYTAYFYVPRGAKLVGGFSQEPRGRVETAEGKVVFDFKAKTDPAERREFAGDDTGGATASLDGRYFSIPVPPSADGQAWRFVDARGPKLLMTVPGLLARTPSELLVPKETVPTP